MRKFLFFLFMAGAINSFAQTKSLLTVTLVKPKPGQDAAFQTAWKTHLKKFHQVDTTNRRGVYEITSGVRTGGYYLTAGGMSWADLDVERPTVKAHDVDLATTVTPTLSTEGNGAEEIFRRADTLSYRPEVQATKFVLTVYNIKTGKQSDVTDELKRSIAVDKKINSPVSFDGFIKQLAGSKPVVVIIRHLKDGFKELDSDYFKDLNDKFKAAYLEMYGQAAWDKRMTSLADLTDLVETEMLKYRADLSSAH
jgi:hypothetical protein